MAMSRSLSDLYSQRKEREGMTAASLSKGSSSSLSPRRALAAALHRDGRINKSQNLLEDFSEHNSHSNVGIGRLAYNVPIAFDPGFVPVHIRLADGAMLAKYKWRADKYVGYGRPQKKEERHSWSGDNKFRAQSANWGSGGKRAAQKKQTAPDNYAERVCTLVGTKVWEAKTISHWAAGKLHKRNLPVTYSATFRIEALAGVAADPSEDLNADYEYCSDVDEEVVDEALEALQEQEEERMMKLESSLTEWFGSGGQPQKKSKDKGEPAAWWYTGKLYVGLSVEANYKGEGDWYPAEVLRVKLNTNEAEVQAGNRWKYDLKYEDGTIEKNVPHLAPVHASTFGARLRKRPTGGPFIEGQAWEMQVRLKTGKGARKALREAKRDTRRRRLNRKDALSTAARARPPTIGVASPEFLIRKPPQRNKHEKQTIEASAWHPTVMQAGLEPKGWGYGGPRGDQLIYPSRWLGADGAGGRSVAVDANTSKLDDLVGEPAAASAASSDDSLAAAGAQAKASGKWQTFAAGHGKGQRSRPWRGMQSGPGHGRVNAHEHSLGDGYLGERRSVFWSGKGLREGDEVEIRYEPSCGCLTILVNGVRLSRDLTGVPSRVVPFVSMANEGDVVRLIRSSVSCPIYNKEFMIARDPFDRDIHHDHSNAVTLQQLRDEMVGGKAPASASGRGKSASFSLEDGDNNSDDNSGNDKRDEDEQRDDLGDVTLTLKAGKKLLSKLGAKPTQSLSLVAAKTADNSPGAKLHKLKPNLGALARASLAEGRTEGGAGAESSTTFASPTCPRGHQMAGPSQYFTSWCCDNAPCFNPASEKCLSGLTNLNQAWGQDAYHCPTCDYYLCLPCAEATSRTGIVAGGEKERSSLSYIKRGGGARALLAEQDRRAQTADRHAAMEARRMATSQMHYHSMLLDQGRQHKDEMFTDRLTPDRREEESSKAFYGSEAEVGIAAPLNHFLTQSLGATRKKGPVGKEKRELGELTVVYDMHGRKCNPSNKADVSEQLAHYSAIRRLEVLLEALAKRQTNIKHHFQEREAALREGRRSPLKDPRWDAERYAHAHAEGVDAMADSKTRWERIRSEADHIRREVREREAAELRQQNQHWLPRVEVEDVLKGLGLIVSAEQMQALWRHWDPNRTGGFYYLQWRFDKGELTTEVQMALRWKHLVRSQGHNRVLKLIKGWLYRKTLEKALQKTLAGKDWHLDYIRDLLMRYKVFRSSFNTAGSADVTGSEMYNIVAKAEMIHRQNTTTNKNARKTVVKMGNDEDFNVQLFVQFMDMTTKRILKLGYNHQLELRRTHRASMIPNHNNKSTASSNKKCKKRKKRKKKSESVDDEGEGGGEGTHLGEMNFDGLYALALHLLPRMDGAADDSGAGGMGVGVDADMSAGGEGEDCFATSTSASSSTASASLSAMSISLSMSMSAVCGFGGEDDVQQMLFDPERVAMVARGGLWGWGELIGARKAPTAAPDAASAADDDSRSEDSLDESVNVDNAANNALDISATMMAIASPNIALFASPMLGGSNTAGHQRLWRELGVSTDMARKALAHKRGLHMHKGNELVHAQGEVDWVRLVDRVQGSYLLAHSSASSAAAAAGGNANAWGSSGADEGRPGIKFATCIPDYGQSGKHWGGGKEWEPSAGGDDDDEQDPQDAITHVYYLEGPLHPLALLQERGQEIRHRRLLGQQPEGAVEGVGGLEEGGDKDGEDAGVASAQLRQQLSELCRFSEQEQTIEQLGTWFRNLFRQREKKRKAAEEKAKAEREFEDFEGADPTAEEKARKAWTLKKVISVPDHTSPIASLLPSMLCKVPLSCTALQQPDGGEGLDLGGAHDHDHGDVVSLHTPNTAAEQRERRGYVSAAIRRLGRRKVTASFSLLGSVGGYDPVGRGMDACALRRPAGGGDGSSGEVRVVVVRCPTIQLQHPQGTMHARDFVVTTARSATGPSHRSGHGHIPLNPHYFAPLASLAHTQSQPYAPPTAKSGDWYGLPATPSQCEAEAEGSVAQCRVDLPLPSPRFVPLHRQVGVGDGDGDGESSKAWLDTHALLCALREDAYLALSAFDDKVKRHGKGKRGLLVLPPPVTSVSCLIDSLRQSQGSADNAAAVAAAGGRESRNVAVHAAEHRSVAHSAIYKLSERSVGRVPTGEAEDGGGAGGVVTDCADLVCALYARAVAEVIALGEVEGEGGADEDAEEYSGDEFAGGSEDDRGDSEDGGYGNSFYDDLGTGGKGPWWEASWDEGVGDGSEQNQEQKNRQKAERERKREACRGRLKAQASVLLRGSSGHGHPADSGDRSGSGTPKRAPLEEAAMQMFHGLGLSEMMPVIRRCGLPDDSDKAAEEGAMGCAHDEKEMLELVPKGAAFAVEHEDGDVVTTAEFLQECEAEAVAAETLRTREQEVVRALQSRLGVELSEAETIAAEVVAETRATIVATATAAAAAGQKALKELKKAQQQQQTVGPGGNKNMGMDMAREMAISQGKDEIKFVDSSASRLPPKRRHAPPPSPVRRLTTAQMRLETETVFRQRRVVGGHGSSSSSSRPRNRLFPHIARVELLQGLSDRFYLTFVPPPRGILPLASTSVHSSIRISPRVDTAHTLEAYSSSSSRRKPWKELLHFSRQEHRNYCAGVMLPTLDFCMPGNELNAGSSLEAAVANNTDVRYSQSPFFNPSLLSSKCHVRSPITALHLQLALRFQTDQRLGATQDGESPVLEDDEAYQ